MSTRLPRRWPFVALVLLVAAGAAAGVVVREWTAPLGEAAPPVPVANRAFASAADPHAPSTVWAVGDSADGGEDSARVVDLLQAADPDRVLYLGDVYETGQADEFRRNMGEGFAPLLNRIAPAPGNHDWPAHTKGYDPFWQRVTGAPTPPWYAFDAGGWRLLSLNSETPADPRQLSWLRGELRRAPGCTLAFLHRPRFSAGRHGDEPDTEPLWAELRGRVPLVLAGHEHDMQRLRPIDGTTILISGAGGHSHYDVDERDPRVAFANDQDDGALKLDLAPGRADLSFVAVDGRVLDRSTTRCATGRDRPAAAAPN